MSWYPPTALDAKQIAYLKLIQNIWDVRDPNGDWVSYQLQPHQIEWHADDVVIKGNDAKTKVAAKSRNTSFTTSSIISQCMAVPHYPDQIIPYIRLNQERAKDLISEEKKLIKHMHPIKLDDGSLYPFDPDDVYMKNSMSVEFPNGVVHRAFPATADASETIRGLRVRGAAGIIDESNFMRDFENIYIALRDASAGSINGKKEFQINIGTTLKGHTPFFRWYDKLKKIGNTQIKTYEWPVFNPTQVNLERSLIDQQLDPIVHWHNIMDLEEKRKENLSRFIEEYMARVVDSNTQFYPTELIVENTNAELINELPQKTGNYFGASDIAYVNDYFTISLFELTEDKNIQRYLFYKRQIDPEEMEEILDNFFDEMIPRGLKKYRIDGNGPGFHIAEKYKKKYPHVIEILRNPSIKQSGQHISFNEYIHTNQLKMLGKKQVELLSDELQIIHYTSWNVDYKAESTIDYGHGDIAIGNAYALMPINWRGGISEIVTSHKDIKESSTDNLKELAQQLIKKPITEKVEYYRKLKKQK